MRWCVPFFSHGRGICSKWFTNEQCHLLPADSSFFPSVQGPIDLFRSCIFCIRQSWKGKWHSVVWLKECMVGQTSRTTVIQRRGIGRLEVRQVGDGWQNADGAACQHWRPGYSAQSLRLGNTTRLSDPGGMQGWVDLVGLLHAEMVYPPEDGHPSRY